MDLATRVRSEAAVQTNVIRPDLDSSLSQLVAVGPAVKQRDVRPGVSGSVELLQLLVVEDNEGDYQLAQLMLAETESWGAGVEFSVAREDRLAGALSRLSSGCYQAVLLDLSLPDAQGLEALRSIRAAAPGVPIILLTGLVDLGLAKEALGEGAQDYLIKGAIDSGLLVRSVMYSVERSRAERERLALEGQLMAAQKLETIGLMAGGVAHDLNNMLQGILSYTNLAMGAAGTVSPARPKLLQIEKLVSHAAELVENLFAVSGRVRKAAVGINLSELVEEAVQLLRPTVRNAVRFRLEIAQNLPPLQVDATQLRQVLANLLCNAMEASTEERGVIVVRTGIRSVSPSHPTRSPACGSLEPGFYVVLEVEDRGSGMDPETAKRVFEPFFTTKSTGRGLGLASVLGIVRGYKGSIDVESRLGEGTRFTVLLPCAGSATAN